MNDFQTNCFQSRDLILFRHEPCRYVEHFLQCEICCIHSGLTIVQVLLSHEYCWLHCDSYEHSPCHRMFLSIFCTIWNSLLSFSHLIIHPVHEWSWLHWHFYFCFIVSNDELLRPCSSLRIDIGSPRSVTRYYLIQKRISRFHHAEFPRERNLVWILVSFPKRLHRVAPFYHLSSFVIIPLWVACWERAFNRLFMILVRCGLLVAADNGVPVLSSLSLSFRTPGILISIASLPRAYCRRKWQIRASPCNKDHHWSRFRCDPLFSWILL